MKNLTRADCEALDRDDPLAPIRDRFDMREGVIYLDGNSLGPPPKDAAERVRRMVSDEWGAHLIGGWMQNGWMEMPLKLGDRLGRLIGAAPGQVAVVDTTSINLFKLLAAALRMRPDRRVILSVQENFPTDLYMIQGLIELLGNRHDLRLVPEAELTEHLDESVALVTLTQTNFKSGFVHDLADLTAKIQAVGALTLWDLAHSAGAFPVDLDAAGADFAVGCSYKYLNAGPGGPAFLYVAHKHQELAHQPLTGWLGHANPFEFSNDYQPADGIRRHVCSSPGVLGLVAFEAALDALEGVDMAAVREKSITLGDLFINLVEARCANHNFTLASPREANPTPPYGRGSQVSFAHDQGYAIIQALIARSVVGDFRAPNIMRFGFTPLHMRYIDVFDTVEHLAQVLGRREWDVEAYRERKAVT